jgi:aspartyl-tRNA(Asn)/glutamyl-tRNA(Gln) amidotransferase subunit A
MNGDDLCYLSATQAMALFHDGRLSPVELLEAVIARYESIAGTVNPFADRYFDEARRRARESEAKFARKDGRLRRLEGIPMAVKENSPIQGKRMTSASLIDTDRVAGRTDPAIERLMRAGANVFARTTMPEFAWLYATHSRLWGVTRNPWRLDVSVGGSSGGSAAALAAGATTIATGGDSTGSIRQPASQCGIVGYQAPYGAIPMFSSSNTYVHHGPMTRTVEDARVMANIMAGPHPLDPNSLPRRPTIKGGAGDLKGMKIAYAIDMGHHEVIEDVRVQTLEALAALADAGAELVEIPVDWASEAIRLGHGNQEFLFCGMLEKAVAEHGDVLSDYVPELLDTARSFSADDYRRSFEVADAVWEEHLGPMFAGHHAFVMPTVSCPEIPAANWQRTRLRVNGKEVTDTDTSMTVLWNMFGRCPVLAVPSGRTRAGLPTGIQLVGRPHDEATVFRLGAALEARRPWLDAAERRPAL